MKNTRWTIMAALLLAAASAAHAQTPVGPPRGFTPPSGPPSGMTGMTSPGSGAPTTGAAGTADSGSVSNAESTQSTTTTTTSQPGLAPDGAAMDNSGAMAGDSTSTGAMPNTGGEPILMSLMGLSLAVGAFAIRKRVSA